MVNKVLIGLGVYLVLLPTLFRFIGYLQRKLVVDRAAAKAPRTIAAQKALPKPIWPTWREHFMFTIKDKRSVMIGKKALGGVTHQILFFLLFGVGLILTVVGFIIPMTRLILIGVFLFWVSVIYAVNASKKLLRERKKLYERLFAIARNSLQYPAEYQDDIHSYIQVLEWEEYVKPLKIEFFVPDTFGEQGTEGFMRQFNLMLGQETSWVPSDEEVKDESGNTVEIKPGWNFPENKVTIYAVPPLPMRAEWKEHYVINDDIAWSFFPIGLGVENGVEITNPETGETENVLGFDFSGEQAGLARKRNVKISDKITTSPMVLIAGGTGGGKSVSLTTPIRVAKNPRNNAEISGQSNGSTRRRD